MGRGYAAAVLFTLAGTALSGCEIPATGVVEAGEPATGIQGTTTVYFVEGGELRPSPRWLDVPVGIRAALELLSNGPDESERSQGLVTELPPGLRPEKVTVKGASVVLVLPMDVRRLSERAVGQLVCTAADARAVEAPGTGPVEVTLRGAGSERAPQRCW
ncbi:hypothetical protein GCM10012280_03020 [Wenjunlia tyrosinilytica]|uniref:GerMN domain-containing protein n=1 Tax=Wenjunlia tyrosinilytica TaxID=1544741 RepID=A0A918DRG3_9ACTN|nr:hypothetical protein GCM10012280_03020 [Wenjunlia tyrosinilytica]